MRSKEAYFNHNLNEDVLFVNSINFKSFITKFIAVRINFDYVYNSFYIFLKIAKQITSIGWIIIFIQRCIETIVICNFIVRFLRIRIRRLWNTFCAFLSQRLFRGPLQKSDWTKNVRLCYKIKYKQSFWLWIIRAIILKYNHFNFRYLFRAFFFIWYQNTSDWASINSLSHYACEIESMPIVLFNVWNDNIVVNLHRIICPRVFFLTEFTLK